MSIALERNNTGDHRIERSGFGHKMACAIPVYNSPEYDADAGDRRREEDRSGASSASSSTSSIGRNSDESSSAAGGGCGGGGCGGGGVGDGEEEVQSEYKGGPLDSLEALEEVLPIKRGISKFYSGKSKSFTSLADSVSGSSIKDIVKPENAYTRKRKNLLAHNNFFNKSHDNIRGSNGGGLSKRPTSCRSLLALAAAMGHSESNSNSESSNSNSSSPVLSLPPLPPQSRRSSNNESSSSPQLQKFSAWRSFSLSDLQGAAATPSITGVLGNNEGKLGKLH